MQSKRERKYIEERRLQQAQRQRRLLIGTGVVAALVLVGLGVWRFMPAAFTPGAPGLTATGRCESVQSFPSLGQEHIARGQEHPAYNSNPPTSGWHWAEPRGQGIFNSPQVQEQLVHDLEHGFIVIQYKTLTPEELQRLTDFVRRDTYHMILAPYPGLPEGVRIALTAWTKLQYCTGVDENAITAFKNAFRDKGPERVP